MAGRILVQKGDRRILGDESSNHVVALSRPDPSRHAGEMDASLRVCNKTSPGTRRGEHADCFLAITALQA